MLAIVATFGDLTEAEVAASALRAAGVHAETFDSVYATSWWIQRQALNGIRVMAPEHELADARALLAEMRATAPLEDDEVAGPDAGIAWRLTAAGLFFIHPGVAWAVIAAHKRINPRDMFAAMALTGAAMALFMLLITVVISPLLHG